MLRLMIAAALALALASPAKAGARLGHRASGGEIVGVRPAACAGIPWCGCWLRLHLGLADKRLNRAREWTKVGSPAAGPAEGVIAVWAHHVGVVTAHLGGGMIKLLSGNDGGAVRNRVRSTRGIIAYRRI